MRARFVLLQIPTLLLSAALAGCGTPSWSIKLAQSSPAKLSQVTIVDHRSADVREFRRDGLRSGRTHLADSNTTPDRITYLKAHLVDVAARRLAPLTVDVYEFDVIWELSIPGTMTMVGGAFVPMPGEGDGKNHFKCALDAAVAGSRKQVSAHIAFIMGPFDSVRSAVAVDAAQACIDGVISQWVVAEFPEDAH